MRDPFGFPLAFFHEMSQFDTQLQRFDLQRGAPVARIDHFNLHVTDVEATFRFWKSLGFRCTEYISTDGPGRADHRRLARAQADRARRRADGRRAARGCTTSASPSPDTAGVMRACDQIAAAGHAASIERGPGRHGVSNAFFVYLRDPSGHRIELYACDYYTGDPDHKPLRWSAADASCRSFWGARAPDRWYNESSVVLGADGLPVDRDRRRRGRARLVPRRGGAAQLSTDIRLYPFQCGSTIIPLRNHILGAGQAGEMISTPVIWFLLTHPRGNVIIDGGNRPRSRSRS